MESTESTHSTKILDSAYSTSCSNSQSRSSNTTGNSDTRSSGSSGYCDKPKNEEKARSQSEDERPVAATKPGKEKDRKKKKTKNQNQQNSGTPVSSVTIFSSTEIVPTIVENTSEGQKDHKDTLPCDNTQIGKNGIDNSPNPKNQMVIDPIIVNSNFIAPSPTEKLEQQLTVIETTNSNRVTEVESKGTIAVTDSLSILQISNVTSIDSTAILIGTELSDGKIKLGTADDNNLICTTLQQILPSKNDLTRTVTYDPVISEDGFHCFISMNDGLVLFVTSDMSKILGYSSENWIGNSFIEIIHPKDRSTFANKITNGIAAPLSSNRSDYGRETINTLYAMLKKCDDDVNKSTNVDNVFKEKGTGYMPFKLVLSFRETPDDTKSDKSASLAQGNTKVLLVVYALLVKSIYKIPDEILSQRKPNFWTRHTAAGVLSHIDSAAVPAIGYFPQDIIGQYIMNYYHPEDLIFLKEAYAAIMEHSQNSKSSFCSKPYRFLIQNGCYITLETEWTSFINPWSRKLEFVTGYHKILRGPQNVNIFEEPSGENNEFQGSTIEVQELQNDILKLLTEPVPRLNVSSKFLASKQSLTPFMVKLMEEVARYDLKLDLPQEPDLTISERDSVMLGEISPHHEYYDSKSSTETPPSYNQLNYNENLYRFFNSRPITMAPNEAMKIEEEDNYGGNESRKTLSPIECSDDSGGSGSGGSNQQMGSAGTHTSNTGTETSLGGYQPPKLTEALLCRHNDDMEMVMLKRHRESRGRTGDKKSKMSSIEKIQPTPPENCPIGHGIKRSGSNSHDGDVQKKMCLHKESDNSKMTNKIVTHPNCTLSTQTNIQQATDVWSTAIAQLPVLSSLNNVGSNFQGTKENLFSTVYYIPNEPQTNADIDLPGPSNTTKVSCAFSSLPYMPTGVVYSHPSLFGQHHLVYSPSAMMYQPYQFQQISSNLNEPINRPFIPTTKHLEVNSFHAKSTESSNSKAEKTSVRVLEPDSHINFKPSRVNVANEDSKQRDEPMPSTSSDQQNKLSAQDDMEESSYSSFYSSVLKTESSTESQQERQKIQRSQDIAAFRKSWRRPEPPWLDNVQVTPELVYRYQLAAKTVNDVLKADLTALKGINQPVMVNDQLDQLYLDLELEGLSARLSIGDTTSGSSSGEEENSAKQHKKQIHYSKLMMIYEENAPFPPPLEN